MQNRLKLLGRLAVFIFWGLGALTLWRIWNYQKSLPDPLGSYVEFTLMFLATFYALALLPINRWVSRMFRLLRLPVANKES